MQHTEDAWLHHGQFQILGTAEHGAKIALDAEAHVNISFGEDATLPWNKE